MVKTVLVHDWLTTMGGAEKVLAQIYRLFPGDVYTLFCDRKKIGAMPFSGAKIHTSPLQKVPFITKGYRYIFPFFPWAVEQLKIPQDIDLILSSSHSVAKGVCKSARQKHICYCYTPVRYAWDLQEEYLSSVSRWQKPIVRAALRNLQQWDLEVCNRVDQFVACSHWVADRIARNYQRQSKVIYPPVDVHSFFRREERGNYYITHSRLVPYKRIDLLIRAFRAMPDRQLVIIGSGPEEKKLRSLASANIHMIGRVEDRVVADLLSKAKGYVFAAEEDFGIGVVEAQASGLPVIAYKKGAVLETVIDSVTGLFYQEPTVDALIDSIQAFENQEDAFNPVLIAKNAERFSTERFCNEFLMYIYKNCF